VLGAVLGLTAAAVYADDPPAAHQAISEYTGPETCAMCHPTAAQEVAASVHYQQQAVPQLREGWPEGQLGGMFSTY
jgi:hypothetical protein